jgi:hypothetical protein
MDREVYSLLEDFLFGNPDFIIIIRLIMHTLTIDLGTESFVY